MALADSVPGVSGGTIAFILGFYDDFIGSLNSLISKDSIEDKKKSLIFLIKLGIGWVTGMILSVLILSSIFDEHIYSISSLFTGFIIVAIPLIMKEEKDSLVGKYKNIIFTIIGALIVGLITYFNPSGSNGGLNLSLEHLNFRIGIICIYCWNDCNFSYGFTWYIRINFIINIWTLYWNYKCNKRSFIFKLFLLTSAYNFWTRGYRRNIKYYKDN